MEQLLSVVIPARNAEATIGACLTSLARQTRKPDAVIVVDDGSRDATVERARAFSDSLPLRLIANRPHGARDSRGAAVARNTGARAVPRGLLFFCDADVVLAPDALAELEAGLERCPQASFAYGSFFFGKRFRAPRFSPWLLRYHNYISTMSLVRREAFPGFDESLPRFQDWDLWLRMARAGKRGTRVRTTLFRTERTAQSISAARSDILEKEFRKARGLPQGNALSRILFTLFLRLFSWL